MIVKAFAAVWAVHVVVRLPVLSRGACTGSGSRSISRARNSSFWSAERGAPAEEIPHNAGIITLAATNGRQGRAPSGRLGRADRLLAQIAEFA
jgi:hypothetical protein